VKQNLEVFTIGHSRRTIEEFIHLLRENHIELVIDVRTVPKSSHNPQFGGTALAASLADVAIDYKHMKELGGFRKPLPNSVNTGWQNDSFRGFADYMQTDEFRTALQFVREIAEVKRTVIMCAEAVPWRCHRSLIADALVVCGVRVWHIIDKTRRLEHHLTPWATVEDCQVKYSDKSTGTSFKDMKA
jgi:uncharacterized protein (DUF488 family)